MLSIDIPMKRLFQRRPADWVKFVEPQCREEWIRPYQTEYTPKQQSRLDHVLEVEDPERGSYLINFEPMGYYDITLPARMLRYRSDIWESTLKNGRGTPPIIQVVIFFYPENDNKLHRLSDRWGESTMLDYQYRVIRIWQESRRTVIDNELVGLYPLLPLMKGQKPKEPPAQALQESIATIQKLPDQSLQQDLLAAMAIMAGRKGSQYTSELIQSMIRREMIMESPIYQEWVKQERAEAKAEGKAEKAQDTICKILYRKLGIESFELQQMVKAITSEPILDWVFEQIIDVTDKETAKNTIQKALAQAKQ